MSTKASKPTVAETDAAILEVLREGPKLLADVVRDVGEPLSRVSNRLQALRQAGNVDHVSGRWGIVGAAPAAPAAPAPSPKPDPALSAKADVATAYVNHEARRFLRAALADLADLKEDEASEYPDDELAERAQRRRDVTFMERNDAIKAAALDQQARLRAEAAARTNLDLLEAARGELEAVDAYLGINEFDIARCQGDRHAARMAQLEDWMCKARAHERRDLAPVPTTVFPSTLEVLPSQSFKEVYEAFLVGLHEAASAAIRSAPDKHKFANAWLEMLEDWSTGTGFADLDDLAQRSDPARGPSEAA